MNTEYLYNAKGRDISVSKILKFGMVGAVGFLIEAVVLTLLYKEYAFNVVLARTVSFSLATLATWLLNRSFTFAEEKSLNLSKRKEYIFYLAIQSGGAVLNFLVFILLIMILPYLKAIPIIPLAAGAVFGFLFNYIVLKRWVYRTGQVYG